MPKKPKILYLVTQDDSGGAQRYVLLLARAFRDRAETAIAVGADGDGWLSAEAGKAGIPVLLLPDLVRAISPSHDLKAYRALRREMRDGGWDLVHANSSKAGVLASLAARGLAGPKVVYTAHGWAFMEPGGAAKRLLYLAMERIAARGRAMTIVLSERERGLAERRVGIAPERIATVPHGIVSPTAFLTREEARRELGLPAEALVVGTIANLYRTKGLDLLVRALDIPPLADADFRLAVLGDGPERESLERAIAASAARDRISLVRDRRDAARYLLAFDLFVLPSRKEGLPLTILEALEAGLPTIATDVGGVAEALGGAGVVVPPGEPAALAASIALLLGDPAARRALAEKSKRRGKEMLGRGARMLEMTWAAYGLDRPRG